MHELIRSVSVVSDIDYRRSKPSHRLPHSAPPPVLKETGTPWPSSDAGRTASSTSERAAFGQSCIDEPPDQRKHRIRSQASEPETTQAVIRRGHKRPMSIRARALKKATFEIACLGMIKGAFQPP